MEVIDSEAVIEPSEELIESFEPAKMPPLGPDGGPTLEPAGPFLRVVTDSQCDRGPCRHRHVLLTAMDAERPMDGSGLERPRRGPDGEPVIKYIDDDGREIYETEPWTPLERHRYCYPSPGVRIELDASEAVHECSLWDPEDPDALETLARDRRRQDFHERAEEAAVAAALDATPATESGPRRRK